MEQNKTKKNKKAACCRIIKIDSDELESFLFVECSLATGS